MTHLPISQIRPIVGGSVHWNPARTGRRHPALSTLACCAALALAPACPQGGQEPGATRPGPSTFLWSWERPDDLMFIDPGRAGVAFLAATIRLQPDGVAIVPRFQPLMVPAGTSLVAVARIEGHADGPVEGSEDWDLVLGSLVEAATLRHVSGLQVDFDAVASQRPFYRSLLVTLRGRLPRGHQLSITALASWCLDDPWIDDLPVDEAIPMLFQMGRDGPGIRAALERGREFGPGICRFAVGLSTTEPAPARLPGRRRFVFNPGPWSPSNVRQILEVRQ
jgi:hypothetical protein